MSEAVPRWPAPAKLNLFLHVIGRRADGYHELQTLFRLLDWGDELTIEPTSDGHIERTGPDPGIPESSDLCLRAARLLKMASGTRKGARIGLHKNVPVGAGLGGGSSNAATVLHTLNKQWHCGFSTRALVALGLTLGADVPLFVNGATAWGEGVGERLRPVALGESWYVLVFPGLQVSTAAVFGADGLTRNTSPITQEAYAPNRTRNDCEPVVRQLFPELDGIFDDLAKWGHPRLTGTGSCIFLEFDEKKQADRATNALKCRYNVRAVRGVDHSPLLAKLSGIS